MGILSAWVSVLYTQCNPQWANNIDRISVLNQYGEFTINSYLCGTSVIAFYCARIDNSCCLVNIALETETYDVLHADDVVNIFYAWR